MTDKQKSQAEMKTKLKYWADVSKKDSPEFKSLAKEALTVYGALDAAGKDDFTKRFQVTKNAKNLGWVRDFKESLNKKKIDQMDVIQKYMTRPTPGT